MSRVVTVRSHYHLSLVDLTIHWRRFKDPVWKRLLKIVGIVGKKNPDHSRSSMSSWWCSFQLLQETSDVSSVLVIVSWE